MVKILEQLNTEQGIMIRSIEVNWATVVDAKDVPKQETKTKCSLKLQGDL